MGFTDIKSHTFFRSIDWDQVRISRWSRWSDSTSYRECASDQLCAGIIQFKLKIVSWVEALSTAEGQMKWSWTSCGFLYLINLRMLICSKVVSSRWLMCIHIWFEHFLWDIVSSEDIIHLPAKNCQRSEELKRRWSREDDGALGHSVIWPSRNINSLNSRQHGQNFRSISEEKHPPLPFNCPVDSLLHLQQLLWLGWIFLNICTSIAPGNLPNVPACL